MIQTERLVMFIVYDHPADFPNEFVCRRCYPAAGAVVFDPELFARGNTLDKVRARIPAGAVRLERSPEDDPVIVETWF